MDYIFALDVSYEAARSGLLRTACNALLSVLFGGISADGQPVSPCYLQGGRVAVMTFDNTIHFHDLSVRHSPSSSGRLGLYLP